MIMSLKNLTLCAALVLPVTLAAFSPALAMTVPDTMDVSCLARDTLSNYLDRAYGEGRIARAELDNGNPVELFASRRGTWTLVEMMPDGLGCVHAYGKRMKVEDGGMPPPHSPS